MTRKSKVEGATKIIRKAVKERATKYQGAQVIDFDKVYEDLLDSGMSPDEAAVALDEYMEQNGFM